MSSNNYYYTSNLTSEDIQKAMSSIWNNVTWSSTTYTIYTGTSSTFNDFEWDIYPKRSLVHLHGVKLVYSGLDSYKYEGVVFDDVSKRICQDYCIIVDSITHHRESVTLIDCKLVSDTLVEFESKEFISPDLYDFELVFYDFG